MSEPDRPRLLLYLALALAICVLGARWLRAERVLPAAGDRPSPGAAAPGMAARPRGDRPASVRVGREAGGRMVVHVAGAVRRPGVYRMPAGARVDSAVRRAGGLTARADVTVVNLAAKLEDGRQVVVPERVVAGAAVPGSDAGNAAATTGAAPATPIDLNTATMEQLDTLDGVGPGIAQRILAYRLEHGGFRSVDELGEVPGIGDKRLQALRPRVRV